MRPFLVPLVLVPAVLLLVVTVVRAWLEVNAPDTAKFVSANVLSLVWLVAAPIVLLRRGASLGVGIGVAALFLLLFRLPVGIVYGLAIGQGWTVAETGEPVRYVVQAEADIGADPSPWIAVAANTLMPVAFGLVPFLVVWIVAWAIAFRGARPLARGRS